MKRLVDFLKNKNGNIAITAVIAMIPILSAVSAATDWSAFSRQRSAIQQSLDAAALASARELSGIGENEDVLLKAYAKDFFEANVETNVDLSTIDFSFNITHGDTSLEPPIPTTIELTATLNYDTVFAPIMGIDEITADITSQISVGNRSVEIALVMDNSGSMSSNSRLSIMQTTTKALVSSIFTAGSYSEIIDPVKFSVVPFAGMVNIGTNNKNQTWFDKNGWSSIHHENFNWDTYQTTNTTAYQYSGSTVTGFKEQINGSWEWLTRLDVFDLLNEEWDGCVEMRPWPYNSTDDVVSINQSYTSVQSAFNADGNSETNNNGADALFVPTFAPDTSSQKYTYKNYGNYYTYNDTYNFSNSYINDFYVKNGIQFGTNAAPDSSDFVNPTFNPNQKGSSDQINRQGWMFKYQSGKASSPLTSSKGPNYYCTTPAITELTDTKATVDSAINAMQANGTTNIQQGLTWGWRSLSDNAPFTGGRPDDDARNMKYIILLTDGNNYYPANSTPNLTGYGAWGYAHPSQNRWNEGLSSSDLSGTIYESTFFDSTPESHSDTEAIMNAHTLQSCNNAKADGVSIFTIAFDVASGSSVKSLLEACSGSGIQDGQLLVKNAEFYYDVNGDNLDDAMASIAAQIGDLRIIK